MDHSIDNDPWGDSQELLVRLRACKADYQRLTEEYQRASALLAAVVAQQRANRETWMALQDALQVLL